ncbi:MAG: 23S rRNA (adenine(2503)-C(2))-methyltransferase RlmN [Peptococcaceae bacterium]|nr:23S rRNA (adenine(2503)-C(2))-methyltransferase RlmN [Peptococcaceae bacterium]
MDIRNLDYNELENYLVRIKEPTFRTKQLFSWLHARQITDLGEAHNVGKKLLQNLAADGYNLENPEVKQRFVSKDGTEKYLMALSDGALIESVLMRYRGDYSKQRNTLCVSSQVGCAMGCVFCATGHQGFERNLTTEEILAEIYTANGIVKANEQNQEIRNIVFMGMGEPFNNFDNVMKAIRILCHPFGMNLSPRRITISTCGVVPKLIEFADLDTDVGLAISLHASNNRDRDALMPVNHAYPLESLIEACEYYEKKTKKRISFEYALIENVNDQKKHVDELKSLLKNLDCHINVIPVNTVSHNKTLLRPDRQHIHRFIEMLRAAGIGASVRQEKGADINGACGQLKTDYSQAH